MSDRRVFPAFHRSATAVVVGLLVVASATTAWALEPQPLVKQGSCPSGYSQSGNYCSPSSGARYAVHKIGSCPSGYSQSGDYCLASSSSSKLAVPKAGSCPSGFSQSGDYCLSSR